MFPSRRATHGFRALSHLTLRAIAVLRLSRLSRVHSNISDQRVDRATGLLWRGAPAVDAHRHGVQRLQWLQFPRLPAKHRPAVPRIPARACTEQRPAKPKAAVPASATGHDHSVCRLHTFVCSAIWQPKQLIRWSAKQCLGRKRLWWQ